MATKFTAFRLEKEEEAFVITPPEEVIEKILDRLEFCTSNILAVAPLNARNAKAVAVVEVASIVATVCPPRFVVVPIPNWSEIVVSVIVVPLSVNPELFKVEVAAQTGSPFETMSTWPGVAEMPRLVSTFEAEA